MGVINVTPDSFSDGGVNFEPGDAAASARRLLAEGAAIVDVGGESTRPGADRVSTEEELRRVVPVLEALQGLPVSIDTAKSEVAARALELGAEFEDDILWKLSRSITVHPLGGCPMGATAQEGVVSPANGEVHNYPRLHVTDGSVMPGTVGANPSFTIAAVANRFSDAILAEEGLL